MKIFRYIASALTVSALLGAVSCSDDVDYNPTPAYTGNEVYFAEDESTDVDIPDEATFVNVNLYRVDASEALTVGLLSRAIDGSEQDVSSIFSIPSEVTFPEGETVVPVQIGVQFSSIVSDVPYYITLAVDGEEHTPYGLSSQTFVLSNSPWYDPTIVSREDLVTITLGWPYNTMDFEQYLYVSDSKISENLKRYTIPLPFSETFTMYFEFDVNYDKAAMFKVDDVDYYPVTTPQLQTSANNGTIMVQDAYSWWKWVAAYDNDPMTDEQIYAQMARYGYTRAGLNPNTGVIRIDCVGFPKDGEPGLRYINSDNTPIVATWYVQMPGYADYSFDYKIAGNFVDATGAEYVDIQVYKGDDIAMFAGASAEGALTDEQIAALADEINNVQDPTYYTETVSVFRVPVNAEGQYTLVTVGYDEGYKPVATGSYTFEFKSVQKESEWEAFGEADYTDAVISSIYNGIPAVKWTVSVERSIKQEGVYRLVNPYKTWPYLTSLQGVTYEDGNYYIVLDASEAPYVNIPMTTLGVNMGDGVVGLQTYADYVLANNSDATKELLQRNGYYGTLSQGVITFHAGTLLGNEAEYKNGAWSFVNLDPENPSLTDNTIEFDPFYGTGNFKVEIYNLMPDEVKARRVSAASNPVVGTNVARRVVKKYLENAPRRMRQLSAEETKVDMSKCSLSK